MLYRTLYFNGSNQIWLIVLAVMEVTMRLRIKIALIIITLFTIPIIQAESIEINGLKHYSDDAKTRIVINLSESAQYKIQFDLEQNIILSLLKTKLNSAVKSFNINDGLVETVAFDNTKGDISNIKILLERPAAFNVFPLEAPARIVIDVLPVDNVFNPEVVAISPSGSEESSPQTEKTTPSALETKNTTTNENNEVKESFTDDNQKTDSTAGILNTRSETEFGKSRLTDTKSLINYGFIAVVLIALIYMGFKLRGVSKFARLIRKNSRILKENPAFANMLNDMEKERSQESVNLTKKAELIIETQGKSDEDSDEDFEEKEEKDSVTETITIPRQYEKVEEMAQRGMDPVLISEKSEVPVGEVNLILDLIKARRSERVRQ
jgi:hypothetical protein